MSDPPVSGSTRTRAAWRFAGYLLALGLLSTSIWYAVRGQREADWSTLADADPWLLLGLLAVIAISSVALPAVQFWLITRPFATTRPLGLSSMQALVASGALLNYSPFRAGLIGRVAYLSYFHGVGYRAAVLTHALTLVVFVATCILTISLTAWRGGFDAIWWLSCLAGLAALAAAGAPLLRAVIGSRIPVDARLSGSLLEVTRSLLLWFLVQALALLFTALRWWAVFRIFDREISLPDAWRIAVIHITAVLIGPANGLGLREWLIGVGGDRGWLGMGLESQLSLGVSASLADRAAEVIVLTILGLIGLAVLRRRSKSEAPLS